MSRKSFRTKVTSSTEGILNPRPEYTSSLLLGFKNTTVWFSNNLLKKLFNNLFPEIEKIKLS